LGNRTPKSRPIHFSFTKEYVVELSGALVGNRGCHLVAFLLNELKGQVSSIRKPVNLLMVEAQTLLSNPILPDR